MELMDWLAIIGAATGCGSLGWQIWRDVRDRGRIRVVTNAGYSVSVDDGFTPIAEIRAVNVGRNAVRPSIVVLRVIGHGAIPIFVQHDTEAAKELVPEEDWVIYKADGDEVAKLRDVVIYDTAGRQHRLGRLRAWRVRRTAARFAREYKERQAARRVSSSAGERTPQK